MSSLQLPLVDPETAAAPVGQTLARIKEQYGFLPNLYRVFANNPTALDGYLALSAVFQRGTLTPQERNLVLLAAARANGCTYCVPVHSTVADMQRDDASATEAIRDGVPIPDARLEALRRLTQELVSERGHVSEAVDAFVDAGFEHAQVLEVVVGVALKTLSNYTNHLAQTPLDDVFAARAWTP